LRFIVEGRRDRFVLERNFLEADRARDFGQGLLRNPICFDIVVDEKHRPAKYRLVKFTSGRQLRAPFQLADELRQQHAERQRAAMYFGLAVDQAGTEQTLEGTHQAAFVPGQVVRERRTPEVHRIVFDVEKHDRRQGRLAVFQLQQGRRSRPAPAYRRI